MSQKDKDIKTKFQKANIRVARAGDELVTFSKVNVNRVQILEAKDSKTTINGKLKDQYQMKVLDLNDIDKDTGEPKKKNFNTASSRLCEKLSIINETEGLIGQRLKIEHIGTGTEAYYEVSKIID